MMLRTVLAGAVALLVAGCDNTSDLEKQCAEECRKAGRSHKLVPKDAPPVDGKPQMQCRCVAN
jgi:hypothetical protein